MRNLGLSIPALSLNLSGGVSPVALANFLQGTHSQNKAALDSVATFSRAGNAMQFDSLGYLTYGPNNLVIYSSDMANSGHWSQTSMTGASGVLAPDGSTNGVTLTEGAGTAEHGIYTQTPSTLISGNNYIGSVALKAGSRRYVQVYMGINAQAVAVVVDTTQTPMTIVGTGANGSSVYRGSGVLSLGGGWYRVYVAGTLATTSGYVGVSGSGSATPAFPNTSSTGSQTVIAWGARISNVTYETAFRIQDDAETTSAAYYGPRFDYTYNGSSWVPAGLTLEDASTNYWTNSEDATAWTRTNCGASVTALGAFGGFALATLTQTSSTLATKVDTPAIASVNGDRRSVTVLLYAVGSKTNGWLGLLGSSSTWGLNGDSTATVLLGSASVVQDTGGLWQVTGLSTTLPTLVRVTRTVKTTENISASFYLQTSTAGTAGDAIKIGVPMFEPGDGSSYVPTGASAVTRAGETLQLAGSALAAATGAQGTMFTEVSGLRPASPTTRPAIFYGNVNGLAYQNYSAADMYSYNGSSALTFTAFDSLKPGPVRVGFAWDASSRALVSNFTIAKDAAVPWASAPSAIYIGGPSTRSINGYVRSLAIYNSRLSDATLQAKSVVGASY